MPAAPVLVGFHCPLCSSPQQASLLVVSRAGLHACTACGRKLKAADVSRALHTPPPIRAPRAPGLDQALPGARTRPLLR
jgi:hypothetical protein